MGSRLLIGSSLGMQTLRPTDRSTPRPTPDMATVSVHATHSPLPDHVTSEDVYFICLLARPNASAVTTMSESDHADVPIHELTPM